MYQCVCDVREGVSPDVLVFQVIGMDIFPVLKNTFKIFTCLDTIKCLAKPWTNGFM